MDFTFGKHDGKPVAWVLLSQPDYFKWMKRKEMTDKEEYLFALKVLKY